MTPTPGPLLVMGAGTLGSFIGARLHQAGAEVHFVDLPARLDRLRAGGLAATAEDGRSVTVSGSALLLHAEPPAGTTLALLTVPAHANPSAGEALGRNLPPGAPVWSLQMGPTSAAAAAAAAPSLQVFGGVVPFRVHETAPGVLHACGVPALLGQRHGALQAWLPLFDAAGLPVTLLDDVAPVAWGQVVLELHQPVAAVCGLPQRAAFLDRELRRVTAALQDEALGVVRAAGLATAAVAGMQPRDMARWLRRPTWWFRRLKTAPWLRVDPTLRNTMTIDLAEGRRTEIDALCGEVSRLAQRHAGVAPLNARMQLLLDSQAAQQRALSARRLRTVLGLL